MNTIVRGFVAAFVCLALGGPGCSSNGSNGSNGDGEPPLLDTAENTLCVMPSDMPQDVELPTTGGVSGTLSFAAFPAGATGGCNRVRVSTGNSVRSLQSKSRGLRLRAEGVRPILTVTVGEGFDENSFFGAQSIVTNMQLRTSSDLNFADGTYVMTITRRIGETVRVEVTNLVAMNGVLTVAPIMSPNGNAALPVLILANSTAVISVYPRGVDASMIVGEEFVPEKYTPPDGVLPPLPTDPPPQSPAVEGAHGLPPPEYGTEIGSAVAIWSEGCAGNPGCTFVRPIYSYGGQAAPIDAQAGMNGTIIFHTNISYMQNQTVTVDCPAEWAVDVGLNGSGSITVPVTRPFVSEKCTIYYSTVPRSGGSGYAFEMQLRGLDIGAH